LDVGPGTGVDIVCPGQDYGGAARSFDVVISCEMMEHNPRWRVTWLNMLRLVKADGLVVMTCASLGRHRHGTQDTTPLDSPLTVSNGSAYYQNLVSDDFTALVHHEAWFACHGWFDDHTSHDLYFFGVGTEVSETVRGQADRLKKTLTTYYWEKNVAGLH
jgi:SAM-dependent methyltransferase